MSSEIKRTLESIPSDDQFMALFTNVSREILDIYSKVDQGVVYKSDSSPQTLADRVSNDAIITYLRKNTPFPVLSEESEQNDEVLNAKHFWIVDPLDGTRDFMAKTGDFSIMIGLVKNHQPIFGVVYHPLTGRCYLARKGEGALLLDKDGFSSKLQVSNIAEPNEMRMVISRFHVQGTDSEVGRRLGIKESNIKRSGSFGLKIGLLAEGKAELFLNSSGHTSIWDSAPNIIILSEAGGQITDIDGNKLLVDPRNRLNSNGIVATNGRNHSEIARKIKETVDQLKK